MRASRAAKAKRVQLIAREVNVRSYPHYRTPTMVLRGVGATRCHERVANGPDPCHTRRIVTDMDAMTLGQESTPWRLSSADSYSSAPGFNQTK